MTHYYASRAAVALAVSLLLALTGSPWWVAVLLGGLVLAFFVWAPHSGRYAVHPEHGVTALRRDERTQMINDKAARNAFVASMLALAGIAIYFGAFAAALVPVTLLELILVLGALTYLASDIWLRRS
jgi:hypothetical protein